MPFPPLRQLLLSPPSCRSREQLQQAVGGKTILMTGASFGIGRAAALLLAGAGAEVLLLARSGDELAELATAIRANGGKASAYTLDLSKPAELAPVVAQIQAAHPRINIIVSNAGKSIRRPVLQSGEKQDVERLLAVNFSGPAALLLLLLPRMVAQGGGQIVNVSSVSAGPPPLPRWAAYQGSKAGFDLWFRSLGAELRGRGVRVCSVYLPLVRTRMIAPTPAYRFAPALTPHEAAEAVAYALVHPNIQRVAPWWMKSLELAALLLPGPLGRLLSGLETLELKLSGRQKR